MTLRAAALPTPPARSAAPLSVAVVAHIRHRIAPPFMGGMEAHSHGLCRSLAARGHRVTLFAAQGSECEGGRAEPICAAPYEDVLPWERYRGSAELDAYQEQAFARAWHTIRSGEFDIVHNNTLFPGLLDWARRDGVPMLTSLHVPPFARLHDAVGQVAHIPHMHFSVTSAAQLPLWFRQVPPTMTVVHNGVDCARWRPARQSRPLVWSGRITPTKGTALAVRAARQAGAALDLIGPVEDRTYFETEVAPLLNDAVRYRGHLTGDALIAAIAEARAAVVTPMWDEPFGLVAAEALACDVPVIAFARGGLPEVVGDCGLLLPPGDGEALAAAMAAPPMLEPGMARARAETHFSLETAALAYERLYARARIGTAHVAAAA